MLPQQQPKKPGFLACFVGMPGAGVAVLVGILARPAAVVAHATRAHAVLTPPQEGHVRGSDTHSLPAAGREARHGD